MFLCNRYFLTHKLARGDRIGVDRIEGLPASPLARTYWYNTSLYATLLLRECGRNELTSFFCR